MPFYTTRLFSIEAEQYHVDRPLPFADQSAVQFGCNCLDDENCTLCDAFWVEHADGRDVLEDGDWVVKLATGFYVLTPDEFDEAFEVK